MTGIIRHTVVFCGQAVWNFKFSSWAKVTFCEPSASSSIIFGDRGSYDKTIKETIIRWIKLDVLLTHDGDREEADKQGKS